MKNVVYFIKIILVLLLSSFFIFFHLYSYITFISLGKHKNDALFGLITLIEILIFTIGIYRLIRNFKFKRTLYIFYIPFINFLFFPIFSPTLTKISEIKHVDIAETVIYFFCFYWLNFILIILNVHIKSRKDKRHF